MKKEQWKLIEPYRGAHIRVKFKDIYHHGIYIDDENVIQFGLPMDVYSNPEDVKVINTSLSEFCGNSLFFEVYVFDKKELKIKKSDEEIVQQALSCIGQGGYNILHNNCEHFANMCVFGYKKSNQIDQIYENVSRMLKK